MLVLTFSCQDICWANPDTLQVELRTTRNDFKLAFDVACKVDKAKKIAEFIDKRLPELTIEKIRALERSPADALKGISFVKSGNENEVLMQIGADAGVVLRYCLDDICTSIPSGFVSAEYWGLDTDYNDRKLTRQLIFTRTLQDELITNTKALQTFDDKSVYKMILPAASQAGLTGDYCSTSETNGENEPYLIYCEVVEGDFMNLAKLRGLLEGAAAKVRDADGKPLISNVLFNGSALYLHTDAKVKLDKIDDIDTDIVLSDSAASSAKEVRGRFLAALKETLRKSNISFSDEPAIEKKTIDRLREKYPELQLDDADNSRSVILEINAGQKRVDIGFYASEEEWADTFIEALIERLSLELGLGQPMTFLATSDEEYIKKYVEAELLTGDLGKYREYRDKFLAAASDEYKELRAEIERSTRPAALRVNTDRVRERLLSQQPPTAPPASEIKAPPAPTTKPDFSLLALPPASLDETIQGAASLSSTAMPQTNKNGISTGPEAMTPGEVVSGEGNGATFTARLPVTETVSTLRKENGMAAKPIPSEATILLSENLFIGPDGDRKMLDEMSITLSKLLNKSNQISIVPLKDIKAKATNKKTTKDKVAVVMTNEDYNNKIWNGSKEESIKSSVLIVDDKLTKTNYLYLESVIGLANAIMRKDRIAMQNYYSAIAGIAIDDDILKLLDNDDENNIAFAIKAILRFKPITIKEPGKLLRQKELMENYLAAA